MATLKAQLKKRLHNAERIALLGIGSELRGDDAAGMLIAEQLSLARRKLAKEQGFKVFRGGTAPENLTGEIKRFKPSHLIIVDSADMGKAAGAVKLIFPDKMSGLSFCTHNLPVNILTDYLTKSLGCETIIIGIQPKRIDFGSPASKEVQKSIKNLAGIIKEIILQRRRT